MRPMDMWIHHDRPMKIEWTTSNDASSSCATWNNCCLISTVHQIESTEPKDVPKFAYKIEMLFDKKIVLRFSTKLNCLDSTI